MQLLDGLEEMRGMEALLQLIKHPLMNHNRKPGVQLLRRHVAAVRGCHG